MIAFHLLQFVWVLNEEFESEARSLLELGLHFDVSAEGVAEHLADAKSETNPLLVQIPIIFDRSKKFEQLLLIFGADTKTGVLDGNIYILVHDGLSQLHGDVDLPLLRILKSI